MQEVCVCAMDFASAGKIHSLIHSLGDIESLHVFLWCDKRKEFLTFSGIFKTCSNKWFLLVLISALLLLSVFSL